MKPDIYYSLIVLLPTIAYITVSCVMVCVVDCLVPRPQYYASVIRFGSRGSGRKVWPRQKSEK